MNYLLASLAGLASLAACSARAQQPLVANRDSAEYYFQQGAGFYEDRRMPASLAARGRRQAMAAYSKAIAFDSSYYWAYRNRGYCHENFGELALALADYNQALAAGQRSGEADAAHVHFNALDVCQQLGRWQEVEAHASALLANSHICAGDYCTSIWRTRGDAYVQLGRHAAARQDYLRYQQAIGAELAGAEQKMADEQLRQAQQACPRQLSRAEKARWQAGNAEQLAELAATAAELRAAYAAVAVQLVVLANQRL